MVRKPEYDKVKYQKNRMLRVTTEEREKDLFIIKPPRAIPFWSQPIIGRVNYCYFSYYLASELKGLGCNDYILWNYNPEYAHALKIFKYKKLVFDIVDDIAACKSEYVRKARYAQLCMDLLVSRSDLVIVTASTLYDKFRNSSRNILLVPNGFRNNKS